MVGALGLHAGQGCSGSSGGTTAWRAGAAPGRRPSPSAPQSEAGLMARLTDGGGWSGAGRAGALRATTPGHGTGRRAHAASDRPERFRICTRLLGSLDLSLNILQLRRRSHIERPASVRTYRNILSGRVHCREAGRLHSEQATSVVALPLSPSVRPQRGSRASRRRARAATATDRDSTAEPPSDPDPTSETRRRADPPGPLSRGG